VFEARGSILRGLKGNVSFNVENFLFKSSQYYLITLPYFLITLPYFFITPRTRINISVMPRRTSYVSLYKLDSKIKQNLKIFFFIISLYKARENLKLKSKCELCKRVKLILLERYGKKRKWLRPVEMLLQSGLILCL